MPISPCRITLWDLSLPNLALYHSCYWDMPAKTPLAHAPLTHSPHQMYHINVAQVIDLVGQKAESLSTRGQLRIMEFVRKYMVGGWVVAHPSSASCHMYATRTPLVPSYEYIWDIELATGNARGCHPT